MHDGTPQETAGILTKGDFVNALLLLKRPDTLPPDRQILRLRVMEKVADWERCLFLRPGMVDRDFARVPDRP